ncbi:hypothetical protein ACQPXS_16450 [Streptomyces sp. CA-142005]|uniref:hypothetical protein n=1 Tax=Streptomyces sp. CA-142005 TaxID=3240052 RepID=UPI003D8B9F3A
MKGVQRVRQPSLDHGRGAVPDVRHRHLAQRAPSGRHAGRPEPAEFPGDALGEGPLSGLQGVHDLPQLGRVRPLPGARRLQEPPHLACDHPGRCRGHRVEFLFERAMAHRARARDPGALYRGARLLPARDAFMQADGPSPELTPLEREFLTASVRSGRFVQPALVLVRRFVRSRWWPAFQLALLCAVVLWTVWFLNRDRP